MLSCGGDDTSGTPDAAGDTDGGANADAGGDGDALDELFGLTVHRIEIVVEADGVESLIAQPRQYVGGAITIDGTQYEDVAVRLKGGAGSFVPLDGDYPQISGDGNGNPGKSAFIVDFNRFVSGQNLLGLEKLTLNNLVQDPSCIHEYLSFALFRETRVPAPRTSWAIVTFNGEEKGIYALVESPDNDELLEKWYGHSDGNLYEGVYGTDLEQGAVDDFDQDSGGDTSKRDLRELVAALDAIGPDDEATAALDARIDLDSYLGFAVTELYLGHWDGYALSRNNYMIHHDPVADSWTWMPWGVDQTFVDKMEPFAGVMLETGPSWNEHGGRIHQICFQSPACRSRLHQAFVDLLDRADDMDLAGLAEQARSLVEDFALAEAAAHGDPSITTESLDGVRDHIETARERIESWLPCLIGQPVDNDGDSYDGCTNDCDDLGPMRHPGADEHCNFVDDDCNGVRDDPPECPPCQDVVGPDGSARSLCFGELSWSDARALCQGQGQELISVHDEATAEIVFWTAMERMGGSAFWIGLNDRDEEGTFTWSDGSPLGEYQPWGPESPLPPPAGDAADCVRFEGFSWWDMPCAVPLPFVCE